LRRFEEAFTSENWIVRIYRVKPRENRESIVMKSKYLYRYPDNEEAVKRESSAFANHKFAKKIVPEKRR
jgi:hypothetical protein